MKISDFIGDYAIHDHYGKVFVIDAPKRSRAMVNIKVVERGPGWNEAKNQYERFFIGATLQRDGSRSLRWGFTNKDEYGVKETVHIKTLKKIDNQ